jgi:hypothetical protein
LHVVRFDVTAVLKDDRVAEKIRRQRGGETEQREKCDRANERVSHDSILPSRLWQDFSRLARDAQIATKPAAERWTLMDFDDTKWAIYRQCCD